MLSGAAIPFVDATRDAMRGQVHLCQPFNLIQVNFSDSHNLHRVFEWEWKVISGKNCKIASLPLQFVYLTTRPFIWGFPSQ